MRSSGGGVDRTRVALDFAAVRAAIERHYLAGASPRPWQASIRMARVEKTLSDGEWLEIIAAARADPSAVWRFDGDDNYFLEGRLEARPTGEPREWRARDTVHIQGIPMWIGHVRSVRRLR